MSDQTHSGITYGESALTHMLHYYNSCRTYYEKENKSSKSKIVSLQTALAGNKRKLERICMTNSRTMQEIHNKLVRTKESERLLVGQIVEKENILRDINSRYSKCKKEMRKYRNKADSTQNELDKKNQVINIYARLYIHTQIKHHPHTSHDGDR